MKTNNLNRTSNITEAKNSNFETEGSNCNERLKNGPVNIQVLNSGVNQRSLRLLDEKRSACLKTNQNSTSKTLATHIKDSEVIC